jgi:hypothetical protein
MTQFSLVARCQAFCLTFFLAILLFPLALSAADPSKVPRTLNAADPNKVLRTPLDQIHFDASTTRAFDRSGQYVTTKVKADGTVQTEVNGSFQNVTVARMGADGVIETYCTTSEQDAKNWMAGVDDRPDSTTLSPPAQDKTP